VRRRRLVIAAAAAVPVAAAAGALAARHRMQVAVAAVHARDDPYTADDYVLPHGEDHIVGTRDGTLLRTVDFGGAGQTVLLVHGVTASTRYWAPVLPGLLDAGHHVVSVDQRGHGRSGLSIDGFSPEALGDDVATVLGQLDLRDVVVVGHSMGGISVQSLLVNHRDAVARRVAAAVILSSVSHSRATTSAVVRAPGLRRVLSRPVRRNLLTEAEMLFGFGDEPTASQLDFGFAVLSDFERRNLYAALTGLSRFDFRPGLATVDVPTVVACGTADRVTPLRYSQEIADALPAARSRWFEGAGHQLPWERRDEVVELITGAAKGQ
jgi:pimeloyl-ACP methyl ester carboxylesterase